MIISITGGAGFVGKKIAAHHINKGDSVRVLTRKQTTPLDIPSEVEIHNGDLLGKPRILLNFVNNSDILYHCAAELNRIDLMQQTHIQGTKKLIGIASGRIGRWVQLSSVGVYGPQKNGTVGENTPMKPIGIYEKTKAKSDELVIDAGDKDFIKYTILRPSIIFGPSMRNQSIFQLIKMVDKRLFFFIGRKGSSANYIHIDNVIDALFKCGKEQAALNQIFNLSDYMVLEDFVAIIARELDKKTPILRLPENFSRFIASISNLYAGFPLTPSRVEALTLKSSYSIKKIKSELGYKPKKNMEQGLSEMVDTYKDIVEKNKKIH